MSVAEGAMLSADERQELYDAMREDTADKAAAAGWSIEGEDPENYFKGEWHPRLDDWPESAGIQVGDRYVKDSITAPVIQGTFVVAKPYKKDGRIRASTLKRVTFNGSHSELQQMRESVGWGNMKEWGGYPDPFLYGVGQGQGSGGGVLGQYLPLWPGPVTRQLYWQDYWMMSSKAFEAYNHDPLSWRCVHLKSEFALGAGLQNKVTKTSGSGKGQSHDKAQIAWDEFWKRNKMDARLDQIARDYCWSGEQFIRYFKQGTKLTIRSLDPATIYDLITDPEDIETVFAYHQQYQTAYQLYPPEKATPPTGIQAPEGPTQAGSIVRYIIRQILPQEIDHYKANCSSSERRGRSDLFPALGWIKRLRDYLTAHVIRADMLSRICWDLEVNGNASAVQALRGQLFPGGRPPQPGTIFGHNAASKLTAVAPTGAGTSSNRGDPILDALVTMISASAGVPKDWLGFGLQNTRAGALVATEPAAKSLIELQGTIETMIHNAFDRCMAAAFISDAELEVTFPSIASEDRQQKLDDLGTMESNQWISKRTAASIAAKEMSITTYDYDAEQGLIAQEFPKVETESDNSGLLGPDGKPIQKPKQGDGVLRRTMIMATKRQAPKLDVTKSPSMEDDPPGLLVPEDGSALPAPGSPDGTKRTVAGGGSHNNGVTRGGAPANENPISSAGAKNIRKDNTNIHESEPVFEIPAKLMHFLLMRERQGARRKLDDPDYENLVNRFRQGTDANMSELMANAKEQT